MISLRKETPSLSILEGHVLTKAVDLESAEIDAVTAEKAHVLAAEIDRVALLQPANFYLILSFLAFFLNLNNLKEKFSTLTVFVVAFQ